MTLLSSVPSHSKQGHASPRVTGLSQIVQASLSSRLEPQRTARKNGCHGGTQWPFTQAGQLCHMDDAQPRPRPTRCRQVYKVISLTIFLLCKNKGNTPQAIWGKRGASTTSLYMSHAALPHPSTAGCPLHSLRNLSPFSSWHPA